MFNKKRIIVFVAFILLMFFRRSVVKSPTFVIARKICLYKYDYQSGGAHDRNYCGKYHIRARPQRSRSEIIKQKSADIEQRMYGDGGKQIARQEHSDGAGTAYKK